MASPIKLILALIFGVILLKEGIADKDVDVDVDVDESRDKRRTTSCGMAYHIAKGKGMKVTSADAHEGKDCEWSVIGDLDCNPEMRCTDVQLKQSDDCDDEALYVSDGYGGQIKACGKVNFDKPVIPSGKARDLFIRYKAGSPKSPPFTCEARCSQGSGAQELPVTVTRKQETRCVCGLQNKDDRIVGGEDAKMNEFPWQAAIVYAGTRSPKCGATLINDRFILTAAHCFWFDNIQANQIEVLLHAYVLDMTKKDNAKDVALGQEGSIRGSGYNLKQTTDKDEHTQRYKVAEIINHPLFTDSYDYDYALLRLEKKIDLSAADAPTPVCLPPPNIRWNKFEGARPWVVGWGMPDVNAGGTTRVLQKLDVPIIKQQKCMDWMPGAITQRMICAGYEEGKKDACTGDSGGPLINRQPNKQWWQIGIVSWGEGCAGKQRPGLYSRVTEMHQWITYHASKADAKWCKDDK